MRVLRRAVEPQNKVSLLAAPLTGALAACGFEPLHLWPLTLLGVAALLALLSAAQTRKAAFLTGWLWTAGHFSVGNGWIATAFTYQANMPAWLGWIAVVGLALYLAVYPALATLAAWHWRERAPGLVLALAGSWIVTEWLRGWVFTGFAWNPLGIALLGPFEGQGLAMLARWVGTYGLSGIAVLLAGCLWLAWRNRAGSWRAVAVPALPLIATVVAMLVTGTIPAPRGSVPYTLVQPNIPQEHIDDPSQFETQFVKTALLSRPQDPAQRRIVLWPESGVPDYLREGYPRYFYQETTFAGSPARARQRLASVIGKDAVLMTGAVDLEMDGDEIAGARNVVTLVNGRGQIVGSYTKAHLVPYGEYLPMRALLEPIGLSRLVPGSLDFLPGPGPQTLDLGRLGKAGFQVCYEIVFSGQVVDSGLRPDYIFNPTNDGWFGAWGPPQHLAQARLRAIEEGLPVLRATTNGISAVIDADGIVRQWVPRFKADRLDGMVPPAHVPTLFARLGNMLPLAFAAILLVLSLLVLRRAAR